MPPILGTIIGAVGSIAGGLIGKSSTDHSNKVNFQNQQKLNAQQFGYQKELNAMQQQYARENADVQYNRQRELTADSWLLNKQGMQAAGINPAFVNGSTNATASTEAAAAPSAGSAQGGSAAPLDFSRSFVDGANMFTNAMSALADKRLKESETERNNIDNMTRMQENLANLQSLKAKATSDEAKADYDAALKDLRIQYDKMNVRNQAMLLDNERSNSDITAQLFGENAQNELALLRNKVAIAAQEGRLKKKEADNYLRMLDAKILNLNAGSALSYAQAAVAPSQAAVNRSVASLNNAQAGMINDTKVDNLAILKSQRVKAWYDAQPQNIQQVIMSSAPVREAIDKAVHGKSLDSSDWSALVGAFGYEKGGDIVESIKDFTPVGAISKGAGKAVRAVKNAAHKKNKHRVPVWKQ